MFVQHLDTELDEDDVKKITSGSKTKAQITVLPTQFDRTDQPFSLELIVMCFTVFAFLHI